jgi:predicted proteasome-type protease
MDLTIKSLMSDVVTAQCKICKMDKTIKSLISDGVTSQLIFYVTKSQLNSNITSQTIDISGHKVIILSLCCSVISVAFYYLCGYFSLFMPYWL